MIEVDDDHEFGSLEITDVKLQLIEKYLKAYITALRGKFKSIWYIDAFAGTGTWNVRFPAREGDAFGAEPTPERVEKRRGSATIALETVPHFDALIFIDERKRHVDALNAIRDRNPSRNIRVVRGDANTIVQKACRSYKNWDDTRAVLFLDPYGMSVSWETLEAIAATRAIDVWYLFSLEGLFRNAAHDIDDVDEHKAAALTRMCGSDAWRTELYSRAEFGPVDLFTGEPDLPTRRTANVAALEQWFTGRLRTIFPLVLEPYALPVAKRPQRFSLYLALANDEPKAMGLAKKIGDQIMAAAGR
ncbi:MAG: three-Cys-motif partner protein TcmP [Hyphomicrobiales bacterium]|nr:MAG: three-Cys-motif partner protein TcmP [Hyphomicrobiales bacterium]